MKKQVGLILGCIILIFSCQKNPCDNSEKAKFKDATGTDGCGMIIELSNGEYLEPNNLDKFNIEPQDGKKIWISYHLAQSGGTICMVGEIIVIDCISER